MCSYVLFLLEHVDSFWFLFTSSYDELSNEPQSVIQRNRSPSEALYYAAASASPDASLPPASPSSASASPSASASASSVSGSGAGGARSSSRNSNSAAAAGEQQSEEQQIEELFRIRCKERDLRALLEVLPSPSTLSFFFFSTRA